MNDYLFRDLPTDQGPLLLLISNNRLIYCGWVKEGEIEERINELKERFNKKDLMADILQPTGGGINILRFGSNLESSFEIDRQIKSYFRGELKEFKIPVELHGTEFQLKVWKEISLIPYGETISYSELAKRIGCPESVRAVAGACGANPVSIIVPCHRIIGSNGEIGGYNWGKDRKRRLLDLETKNKKY